MVLAGDKEEKFRPKILYASQEDLALYSNCARAISLMRKGHLHSLPLPLLHFCGGTALNDTLVGCTRTKRTCRNSDGCIRASSVSVFFLPTIGHVGLYYFLFIALCWPELCDTCATYRMPEHRDRWCKRRCHNTLALKDADRHAAGVWSFHFIESHWRHSQNWHEVCAKAHQFSQSA